MSENLIKLLNTVRYGNSQQYKDRIPVATQDNLESIRFAMTSDENIMVANEFTSSLLNKLVRSELITKRFENPLKSLKKGKKPLGDTVEEIYVNFIKAEAYNGDVQTLLKRHLPDVKAVYHRMNSQLKYPVTISRADLYKAFSSWDNLESFIRGIIDKLYTSAELDEYLNTKQLIKSALDNNAVKVVTIKDPVLSEANGKEFIKTIKTVSGLMPFPSDKYNSYLEAQNVDKESIITLTRKKEQVLILDVATDTSVSVDVLASLFNMSVAEFNDTRKIVIDTFPDENLRAFLVDEQFFQIFDDLFYFDNFKNPETLYDNYYLHTWQTFAYSILVNGIAFMVGSDTDNDSDIESFTLTQTLADGVTSTNKRKTVNEGGSFTTTLKGAESKTVVVTMAGATLSDVYDSVTGTIRIEEITGNIEITVS